MPWKEQQLKMLCKWLTAFNLKQPIFSNHEWFRINLPAYLFPPINEGDASIIDIDAVRDVAKVNNRTNKLQNFKFRDSM